MKEPGRIDRAIWRCALYALWTVLLLPAQILAVALRLRLAERIPLPMTRENWVLSESI